MNKIKVKMGGMHCAHCIRAVEEVLANSDGVKTSSVSIGAAEITTEDHWSGMADLKSRLDREGFRVQDVETVTGQ